MGITTKELKHIAELIQYAAPAAERMEVSIGYSILSGKRTVRIAAEYKDETKETLEIPFEEVSK